MTGPITVEWDSRDLAVWRSAKVDRAIFTAVAKAGGDAIRKVKTHSVRDIRARKRMKAERVRRGLPIIYPSGGGRHGKAKGNLVWKMRVSGDPMPLSIYPHRQTKKGVMVEVNKGSRKLVRSAFIATMKSGHKGIFRREGKSRLPINELWSTRISDVFYDAGFIPRIRGTAMGEFSSTFMRLLPMELDKIRRMR